MPKSFGTLNEILGDTNITLPETSQQFSLLKIGNLGVDEVSDDFGGFG